MVVVGGKCWCGAAMVVVWLVRCSFCVEEDKEVGFGFVCLCVRCFVGL